MPLNHPTQKLRLPEVLLSLSGCAFTLLVSWRGGFPSIILGVAISFVSLLLIQCHVRFADIIHKTSRVWLVIASVFTFICIVSLVSILQSEYSVILAHMKRFKISKEYQMIVIKGSTIALGALASGFTFCLFSCLLPKLYAIACRLVHSLEPSERAFIIIFFLLGVFMVTICYSLTNCFYLPYTAEGTLVEYDVVFTSDTGVLINNNAFMNIGAIQNDINQMLFGVFAMPLGIIATLFSKITWFVPNGYAYWLGALNVLLLSVTILLLVRMSNLKGTSKILCLCVLSVSYPTMLFLLNLEQYVLALFLLSAFLYTALNNSKYKSMFFLGAAGTLITSGITFPLLLMPYEHFKPKKAFNFILKIGICYVMLIAIFGKLPYLLNIFQKQSELLSWYGGVSLSFEAKLLQFLNFVGNSLFAPVTQISFERGFPRFTLVPISWVSLLGIVVLLVSILGFIQNRQNRFVQICGLWILFSFFVTVIMGWGTVENGLILYSLYFGWAFQLLCFLAIDHVLLHFKRLRLVLQSTWIFTMVAINGFAILNLIRFGISYYPV